MILLLSDKTYIKEQHIKIPRRCHPPPSHNSRPKWGNPEKFENRATRLFSLFQVPRVVSITTKQLHDPAHDQHSLSKPNPLILGTLGGHGSLRSKPAPRQSNQMFLRKPSHPHQIDQQLPRVNHSVHYVCIRASKPTLTPLYPIYVIFGPIGLRNHLVGIIINI